MTITPCPTCQAEPKVTHGSAFCTIECVNAACPERPSVEHFLTSSAVDLWNSAGWYSGRKGD